MSIGLQTQMNHPSAKSRKTRIGMRINGIKRGFLAAICALYAWHAQAATTLLPNGKQCFSATTGINGMLGTLGAITPGAGYVAGTYGNVPLTGGSGTTATANITVAGGVVTSVIVQIPGKNYVVGDVLSASNANLGGAGAGFSIPVASISVNASLAGGSVNMFIPATTMPKQTWQDANQLAANTNPVILDSNGCAVMYGTGTYRQQVLDSLGNLIWDQLVTDTSATNNSFWAGTAGGSPNTITVTDAGFNSTDGSVIQFIPIANNTGPTTLTPSGTGIAVPIVKDTAAGAVALSGGEIVSGSPSNVVQVIYSASQANFHLLNLVNLAAPTTQQTLCGAIGLKIINNSGTPNTLISLTADQVTASNNSFQIASRLNANYTINISLGTVTSTANGMDGESPGTSAWIYLWAIDNGSGGAGLASLSATAPTLPSGYSYKCRLGAMRVDGGGNLMRTVQFGSHAQYIVTPGSNTTTAPLVINGVGTSANCSTTTPTWQNVNSQLLPIIPPVATTGDFILWPIYSGAGSALTLLAPNGNYGGAGAATANPPFTGIQNGLTVSLNATMTLEVAQTAYYCGAGVQSSLWVTGWKDKVNAN